MRDIEKIMSLQQEKQDKYTTAILTQSEKIRLYNQEKRKINQLDWISSKTYEQLLKELAKWLEF